MLNQKQLALDVIKLWSHEFRPEFDSYVMENWPVYVAFEQRALRVAEYRNHYSARTIAEVIRHDTAIGEIGGDYKINNNFIPDLARLFALMNPKRAGLFAFRAHKAAA